MRNAAVCSIIALTTARRELNVRLGITCKKHPSQYTSTMSTQVPNKTLTLLLAYPPGTCNVRRRVSRSFVINTGEGTYGCLVASPAKKHQLVNALTMSTRTDFSPFRPLFSAYLRKSRSVQFDIITVSRQARGLTATRMASPAKYTYDVSVF